MIADPALMFQASAAIFLKRLGEHLDGGVPEMDLNPVIVHEKGLTVVDARVVLTTQTA